MARSLINHDFPSLWDESALRPYLAEVSYRHGLVDTIALPNMRDLSPVQIEKLFIQPELSLSKVDALDDPQSWPKGRSLLYTLENEHFVVLLGDPGSGKTTLINWLAWRLSSGLSRELPAGLNDLLPLPCVLREMKPEVFHQTTAIDDLAVVIANQLLGDKLGKPAEKVLREYVKRNQYILLLDGVDEISFENRKVVAQWILSAKQSGAYVVATSRIVGYEEYPIHTASVFNKDAREFEGENKSSNYDIFDSFKSSKKIDTEEIFDEGALDESKSDWAALRYLMPFDEARIKAFLSNWYLQRIGSEKEAREQTVNLLSALKQSKSTYELARTPNLLSLIAIVYRERAQLPDGRALLYKEISNAYINTIDKQRRIEVNNGLLRHDWAVREGWLAFVGFKMQMERSAAGKYNRSGILVEKSKVLSWLIEAMTPFFNEDTERNAIIFLDWVARRSGLLLPRGDDLYAFSHLSFQEYFCARYLVRQTISPKFIKGKFTKGDLVTHDSLRDWARDSTWLECVVYFFELISSENNPEWVSDLLDVIFNLDDTTSGIFDGSADLIARIFTNVHINIEKNAERILAERCSCNDGSQIERAMASAGYGVLIDGIDRSVLSLERQGKLAKNRLVGTLNKSNILKVSIYNTGFSSVSALKDFDDIRALNLISCPIRSALFLKRMKKLKQLKLIDTKLKNIDVVSGLNNLTYFYLKESNVSDLSPIADLADLGFLSVGDSDIYDISMLNKLVNIFTLELSGLQLKDISVMKNFINLRHLVLERLTVEDYSCLAFLKKLKTLVLSRSPITDISMLSNLNNLSIIDCSRTKISDFSPLVSCGALRELRLRDASFGQLSKLSCLKKIESLILNGSVIEDAGILSGMSNLRELRLEGAKIRDISAFASLKNLEYLDLDNTQVNDVSSLATLKNLKILFLNRTEVKSISSLKHLSDLRVYGVSL